VIEGTLSATYEGNVIYTFEGGAKRAFFERGSYRTTQFEPRKAGTLEYCCGTVEQCDRNNGMKPENPRVACNRSSVFVPSSNPPKITIKPLKFIVTNPPPLPLLEPTPGLTICSESSDDGCPLEKNTTIRILRVQQGSSTTDASEGILGYLSAADLNRFVNESQALSSAVVFSPFGCDFGTGCVQQEQIRVGCKPGCLKAA
jgi:hypothetical protein